MRADAEAAADDNTALTQDGAAVTSSHHTFLPFNDPSGESVDSVGQTAQRWRNSGSGRPVAKAMKCPDHDFWGARSPKVKRCAMK